MCVCVLYQVGDPLSYPCQYYHTVNRKRKLSNREQGRKKSFSLPAERVLCNLELVGLLVCLSVCVAVTGERRIQMIYLRKSSNTRMLRIESNGFKSAKVLD